MPVPMPWVRWGRRCYVGVRMPLRIRQGVDPFLEGAGRDEVLAATAALGLEGRPGAVLRLGDRRAEDGRGVRGLRRRLRQGHEELRCGGHDATAAGLWWTLNRGVSRRIASRSAVRASA